MRLDRRYCCFRFGQCEEATDTIMGPLKCLFGVVIVVVAVSVCDVTAQNYWMPSLQRHQPQPQSQQLLKVPPSPLPFDKCQVEENEKIQCGTSDISAEQCENINCCFDGQQCFYGKAGICAL